MGEMCGGEIILALWKGALNDSGCNKSSVSSRVDWVTRWDVGLEGEIILCLWFNVVLGWGTTFPPAPGGVGLSCGAGAGPRISPAPSLLGMAAAQPLMGCLRRNVPLMI